MAGLDAETLEGDITDPSFAAQIAAESDAVFHCAAMIWIGRTRLRQARQVNVEATRNIARRCREAGVRLIHVSSVDALASSGRSQACTESDLLPAKPESAYTISKREAEEAVLAEIEDGLDATIVNPSFMLGPYDWAPSSGQMMLALATRFVPLAPGGGLSVTDVRDVCDGTLAALEQGKCGERYILAGHNLTYLELWQKMAAVAGRRGPRAAMGPAVSRVVGGAGEVFRWVTRVESQVNLPALRMGQLYHYYDSSKAQRELGYQIRPLQPALEDTWDWIRREFIEAATSA